MPVEELSKASFWLVKVSRKLSRISLKIYENQITSVRENFHFPIAIEKQTHHKHLINSQSRRLKFQFNEQLQRSNGSVVCLNCPRKWLVKLNYYELVFFPFWKAPRDKTHFSSATNFYANPQFVFMNIFAIKCENVHFFPRLVCGSVLLVLNRK